MVYQILYKHFREAEWHLDGYVHSAQMAFDAMMILRTVGMECVEVKKIPIESAIFEPVDVPNVF